MGLSPIDQLGAGTSNHFSNLGLIRLYPEYCVPWKCDIGLAPVLVDPDLDHAQQVAPIPISVLDTLPLFVGQVRSIASCNAEPTVTLSHRFILNQGCEDDYPVSPGRGQLQGVAFSTGDEGPAVSTKRFIGGASGPTRGGSRLHATWPLVALSVGPGRLCLSGRGPLRRVFRESVADPANVSAEPVTGPFMDGVVITVGKDERWLFWTWRQAEVLAKLREMGATVAQESRGVGWSDMM